MSGKRIVHAPRGNKRTCKGWHQEAALRMLMNNLDPTSLKILNALLFMVEPAAPREAGKPSTRLSDRCANWKMMKRFSSNLGNRWENSGHMTKRHGF